MFVLLTIFLISAVRFSNQTAGPPLTLPLELPYLPYTTSVYGTDSNIMGLIQLWPIKVKVVLAVPESHHQSSSKVFHGSVVAEIISLSVFVNRVEIHQHLKLCYLNLRLSLFTWKNLLVANLSPGFYLSIFLAYNCQYSWDYL